jgi:hypothetical protein
MRLNVSIAIAVPGLNTDMHKRGTFHSFFRAALFAAFV